MNSWLPPAITALGVLVNIIWTVINMQMRAQLARQIVDLKDWIGRQFVYETICKLRRDGCPALMQFRESQ
jgi:hypothetical protein